MQLNAANGRDPNSTALHVCQCPPCFTAFAKANGVIECTPKCDLSKCDEDSGVCSEGGGSGDASCPGSQCTKNAKSLSFRQISQNN